MSSNFSKALHALMLRRVETRAYDGIPENKSTIRPEVKLVKPRGGRRKCKK